LAIVVPNLSRGVAEVSPGRAAPAVESPATSAIQDDPVNGPYGPGSLRSAYDLPSETAGTGQTVGIVDAFDDPNAESDLAKYRSQFGLPACTSANGCFKKVNQTGGTTYPEPNALWSVEISLDVDMVSAACPNCHILLVEASSNGTVELGEAENEAVALGATELNDSWGGKESPFEAKNDPDFDHPGIPITVAAGDTGDVPTYPAANPNVIAVGGTVLKSQLGLWSEHVWGGEGKEGTGSGCSAYEPKPAWQTDAGCANRTENDVAAVASTSTPVWVADSYEDPEEAYPTEAPGWMMGAGTSASSALMSGIMALTTEYTRSFPGAEALYREAAQHGTGALHDVKTGNNGTCGSYLCEAGPGYDGPTGLGSPDGPPIVLPAVQQEPQGSWVGKVGSAGYLLAGWSGSQDVSDLPGVTATLVQGSRWQWASNSSDTRALQGPEGSTRNASTYYDPNEVKLNLSFSAAYSGNLHLYALDWDSQGRRETISVNGQAMALSMALTSSFSQGAWLTFPINVAAGGTVKITVTRQAGGSAVLSGIFLGEAGPPPAVKVESAPQGSWVNTVGSSGYDLASFNGSSGDLSYLPNATVTLTQGSRWQWAQNSSDQRALSDPGGDIRNAGTYYDPNEIQMKLSFNGAYSGDLHLYAVDWDSQGRREVISVNGQSALLSSDFTNGAWVSFPVSVAAGGTVSITVTRTGGSNAVLSGIFLGDAGAPPGPTVTSSPQGKWVNAVGSGGYALTGWNGAGGDLSYLSNAALTLTQGSRYEWAGNTTDPRALTDPGEQTRNAGTVYDPNEIQMQLSFSAAYSGTLHLYALDWDSAGRREVISVNGQSIELATDFSQGAWVSFPIKVAAGASVSITVTRLAGPNAVLSGIFLGEGGPPPGATVSSAPQGSWVNAYGSVGYDLAAWNGTTDLTELPKATLTVEQASRYVWSGSTIDVRALESPNASTREAATYYDPSEIKLKLSFKETFSGNLRLYAVDWDSASRREVITVNGQSAALTSDFSQGAWVSFPISVAASGTVSIVVDRTAGPNAVLSGLFLG
jgi:hypothetical protein